MFQDEQLFEGIELLSRGEPPSRRSTRGAGEDKARGLRSSCFFIARLSGFAARCEAGLSPAGQLLKKLGATPPVRPLANAAGKAQTRGLAPKFSGP